MMLLNKISRFTGILVVIGAITGSVQAMVHLPAIKHSSSSACAAETKLASAISVQAIAQEDSQVEKKSDEVAAQQLFETGINCLIRGSSVMAKRFFLDAATLKNTDIAEIYKEVEAVLEARAESGDRVVQARLVLLYQTGFEKIKRDMYKVIQWALFLAEDQIRAEQKAERVSTPLFTLKEDEHENDAASKVTTKHS